jgi:hypothetical protein
MEISRKGATREEVYLWLNVANLPKSTVSQSKGRFSWEGMWHPREGRASGKRRITHTRRQAPPYEHCNGEMNQLLTESIEQMVEGIVHRKKLESVLHRAVAGTMAMPRTGMPGTRP